ncbi:MAG: FixH family protein [Rhizobiaceae bacterium]
MMTKNTEFRFTGWHMLACMFAFFGVIIVVNFTMASMASSSWTGLVVKNSYVASQKFNAELALAEAQQARGWHSEVAFSEGKLTFGLVDKDGEIIVLDQVSVVVGRPAFEQLDQRVSLAAEQVGQYATALDLAEGDWALKFEARAEGIAYRRDLRLFVSGGTGLVQ